MNKNISMLKGGKKLSKEEITEAIKLRSERRLSFKLIGRLVGRDHSTIMYHCKKAGVQLHYVGITNLHSVGLSKPQIRAKLLKAELNNQKIPEQNLVSKRYIPSRKEMFPDEGKSTYEEILKKFYERQKYIFESDRLRDLNNAIVSYRYYKIYG